MSSKDLAAALAPTSLLRVRPHRWGIIKGYNKADMDNKQDNKHSSRKGKRKVGGVYHPAKEKKKLAFSHNTTTTSQVTEQS